MKSFSGCADGMTFPYSSVPKNCSEKRFSFGADGGVTGGANLNPRLFVSMYEAAVRGDIPEMRRLQGQIYQQRKLYSIGHHQSSIVKGIKCALSIKKICSDYLAEPFNHFEEKEKNEVRKILDTLPIP